MIKKYNQFISEGEQNKFFETSEFTIYDFLNWTRENTWSESVNKSELVKYTDQFIGKGQWSIIESYFERVFKALANVDIDYIDDRLQEVFDEYTYHDMKYVVRSVTYGDLSNYDKPVDQRYVGLYTVKEITENLKLNIIINFLNEVLENCLKIYNWSNYRPTRVTRDEVLVTSDEWSLKNFKNQNLEIFNDESITSRYSFKKFIDFKNDFSIERCLDMYKPAIYIVIGTFHMNAKFSHNKIRKELEEVLPSALHDIDYEDIIWGMKSVGEEDIEIYDYSVKILLKMP